MTEDMIRALFSPCAPEYRLLEMMRTRDGADARTQINQMMAAWAELLPPGTVVSAWEYEEDDPNVTTVVDNRPITFSAEFTGVTRSGQRTVDTFLDQTVFGAPITSFDLWQKTHLHESSRRANNQCGIDVIAASSHIRTGYCHSNKPRFTAEEAAQRLVTLAKEHFPESALALCEEWGSRDTCIRDTRVAKVVVELQSRPSLDELLPYVPKMEDFLQKPKSLEEIKEALAKGNIYRKAPALPMTLTKALTRYVTWTKDSEHRLLTFLCRFPDHFVP